jgi:hypothetical protein
MTKDSVQKDVTLMDRPIKFRYDECSNVLQLLLTANAVPSSLILFALQMGGDTFLRNISSYKNRKASNPRRRHSS